MKAGKLATVGVSGRQSAFLAEAKRLKRPVHPATGVELQKVWKDALNAPPEQKAVVQEIFGDSKKK